jgi:hypothetical protein
MLSIESLICGEPTEIELTKKLGPTLYSNGGHEHGDQDKSVIIPYTGMDSRALLDGEDIEYMIDDPMIRWHKSYGDYSSHLADIDDQANMLTDDFHRNEHK